jgi:hypothetical protein
MKKSWNSCQDNTSWKFWEFNHGGILTLEVNFGRIEKINKSRVSIKLWFDLINDIESLIEELIRLETSLSLE